MKAGRKKLLKNMTTEEYIRYIGITDQDVIDQLLKMESFRSPSAFNKSGEVYLLVGITMCNQLRNYWKDCVGYSI